MPPYDWLDKHIPRKYNCHNRVDGTQYKYVTTQQSVRDNGRVETNVLHHPNNLTQRERENSSAHLVQPADAMHLNVTSQLSYDNCECQAEMNEHTNQKEYKDFYFFHSCDR